MADDRSDRIRRAAARYLDRNENATTHPILPTKKPKLGPEKKIQNAILKFSDRDPRLTIWRQNVGLFYTHDGRRISAGFPGLADLTGLLYDGKRIEIEVKSARGRVTDAQRNFGRMIRRSGGVYLVAHSVHDVRSFLDGYGE